MRQARIRAVNRASRAASAGPHGTALPAPQSSEPRSSRRRRIPTSKRANWTEPGASATASSSRHESDTIDLLEAGRSPARELYRRLAQEAGAAAPRSVLDPPYRLAGRDHLAQLVVQQQDLGDRAAPAIAGAPA